jgi:hypothetical protein
MTPMKRIAAFTFVLLLISLTGCVTTSPRDVLVTPASTAAVTAFEPIVRGINVGTTVFQNRRWEVVAEGFNANETAATAISTALLQPMAVLDGRTIGLAVDPTERLGSEGSNQTALVRQLTELGRTQKVDRLLLVTTGNSSDWIAGTNQRLAGLGLYRRELFGMKRLQVYGVVQLHVFDCRTQKFSASDTFPGAQEVFSVQWRENWVEFSAAEQRRIIAAWTELLERQIAQLLTRAGLANARLPEKTVAESLLITRPNRPKSWLPDGDTLPIPRGVSADRARAAVLNGLKARGWTVVSQKDNVVTGVYRDGTKEAGVTARISDTEIQLVGEANEIRADGSRLPAKPFTRWQNNLKESVYRDLLNAEAIQEFSSPKAP